MYDAGKKTTFNVESEIEFNLTEIDILCGSGSYVAHEDE
jgi:hypothetical protein